MISDDFRNDDSNVKRLDTTREYSLEEFFQYAGEERYELHDGYPVLMSPASAEHEGTVANLIAELVTSLRGGPCSVYGSNLAVVIPKNKIAKSSKPKSYCPDITVLCDRSKIKDGKCYGAPDLVAEVLSASNSGFDFITKLEVYQALSVREYWIVDCSNFLLHKYVWDDNLYKFPVSYSLYDQVKSTIFESIEFPLNRLFEHIDKL